MKNFKIEINFEDVIEDMFYSADSDEYGCSPTISFKDAVKDQVVKDISSKIIKEVKEDALSEASKLSKSAAINFIDSELNGIITRKLRSGEINTRYDGFKNFDELVEKRINSLRIEDVISKHIDIKAKEFAREMKSRYDNIFAAKIVSSLKEQKMLSPDVAKLLLGE